jgi:hypothetical protein
MTAVDLMLFPEDDATVAAVHGRPPKNCFYCGIELVDVVVDGAVIVGPGSVMPRMPVVIWSGHGDGDDSVMIGLHSDCAIQLAAHFGKDALNARYGVVAQGKFFEGLDEDMLDRGDDPT